VKVLGKALLIFIPTQQLFVSKRAANGTLTA
jgi:hypothetical protein